MAEIDLFANQLLEEAKRFFEKGRETADAVTKAANLHAALMLAFCALEAHVNSIGEEFSNGIVLFMKRECFWSEMCDLKTVSLG